MKLLSIFLVIGLLSMGCEATEIKKSGESRIGRPDAESWQATITLTNEGA